VEWKKKTSTVANASRNSKLKKTTLENKLKWSIYEMGKAFESSATFKAFAGDTDVVETR